MANDRIKGLRRKNSQNSYDSLIPFGTDGAYTDLLSSLNLEEELKLGGNHSANISEVNNKTVITETYDRSNKTKQSNIYDNIKSYQVETTIEEDGSNNTTIITQKLSYMDQNNVTTLLHSKRTEINESGEVTVIEEKLDPE